MSVVEEFILGQENAEGFSIAEKDAIWLRCESDFFYWTAWVDIQPKSGPPIPFVPRPAQRLLVADLERQLAEMGKIRMMVPKGRQMGLSTVITLFYLWRSIFIGNLRTFTLTHQQDATDNLFLIVRTALDSLPSFLKPHEDTSNKRLIHLDGFKSRLKIGTAGSQAVGRGHTFQQVHGSEVAYWPFASTHQSGLMQAVPDEPGTAIINESTGNGSDPVFKTRCNDAEKGRGDYRICFLKWFLDPSYRRPVPEGFSLDSDDEEYMEAHGLDLEQMAWRRNKEEELHSPEEDGKLKFKIEYPATLEEVFTLTGRKTYITPTEVAAAMKRKNSSGEILMIGVDPNGAKDEEDDKGVDPDSYVIAQRSGLHVPSIDVDYDMEDDQAATMVIDLIKKHCPKKNRKSKYRAVRVIVDGNGVGQGFVAIMRDRGYGDYLKIFKGGEKSSHKKRWWNKRTEFATHLKSYFTEGGDLPSSVAGMEKDLCALSMQRRGADNVLSLQSKKEAARKDAAFKSPGIFDALSMTFYMAPVVEEENSSDFYDEPLGYAYGWAE